VAQVAALVPYPTGWTAVMGQKRKSQPGGTSKLVRVWRGKAKVWFYRNESSIDVYVRPADSGTTNLAAPICFRISARDFTGRQG
jgi:hypothetical protein